MPTHLLLIALLLLAAPAAAEGFLEIYGGYAITQDDDHADADVDRPIITTSAEFEDSPLYGLRIGAWSERWPWLGGALDFSVIDPDGSGGFDGIDLDVYPVSALLMLRYPLWVDESDHPHGQLQPYLAVGPSIFVSDFDLPIPGFGSDIDDTSLDPGLDARLGATFLFVRDAGVFLEYRFTYFEPIWDGIQDGVSARVAPVMIGHAAQLGFTVRF